MLTGRPVFDVGGRAGRAERERREAQVLVEQLAHRLHALRLLALGLPELEQLRFHAPAPRALSAELGLGLGEVVGERGDGGVALLPEVLLQRLTLLRLKSERLSFHAVGEALADQLVHGRAPVPVELREDLVAHAVGGAGERLLLPGHQRVFEASGRLREYAAQKKRSSRAQEAQR